MTDQLLEGEHDAALIHSRLKREHELCDAWACSRGHEQADRLKFNRWEHDLSSLNARVSGLGQDTSKPTGSSSGWEHDLSSLNARVSESWARSSGNVSEPATADMVRSEPPS